MHREIALRLAKQIILFFISYMFCSNLLESCFNTV